MYNANPKRLALQGFLNTQIEDIYNALCNNSMSRTNHFSNHYGCFPSVVKCTSINNESNESINIHQSHESIKRIHQSESESRRSTTSLAPPAAPKLEASFCFEAAVPASASFLARARSWWDRTGSQSTIDLSSRNSTMFRRFVIWSPNRWTACSVRAQCSRSTYDKKFSQYPHFQR